MLGRINLIFSLLLLVVSLWGLLSYWDYRTVAQDIQKLATEKITPETLDKEIEEAIADNDPKGARMYLDIGALFGVKVEEDKYLSRIKELERPLKTAKRKVGQFFKGFFKGKAETGAGIAGAITSDFTVIGDVRDLREQYKIHKRGEEVNKLIVTLAGVGVGLTASTLLSRGATSPVKAGTSTLKLAVKSKKITQSMQKILLKQSGKAFNAKGFFVAVKGVRSPRKIKKIAKGFYSPSSMSKLKRASKSMNTIRKSTSLADSVHLMKYVKNGKDLRRLEKVSRKYGKNTKGLFKLLGKAVIGVIRTLKLGTELIISMIFLFISFLSTSFSVMRLLKPKKKSIR